MNKGDEIHEEYRSRLVAMEFKVSSSEDLFAATPPLEAVKTLMSLATTEGIGYDRHSRVGALKLDLSLIHI